MMKPAGSPSNSEAKSLASTIEIRKIEDRDFAAIAALNPWELKKKQPLYPRWLHASAPVPGAAWAAFHGKTAAGYFGTAAVMFKAGEANVPGHHGDLFVHGRFRGTQYNIFPRLVKATVGEVTAKKHMMFGFPRLRLIKFYQEVMGGTVLKNIPRYEFIPQSGFFKNLAGRIFPRTETRSDLKILKISSFDARFDRLWQKVSPVYPVIAVRDSAYLNWRYAKEPGGRYVFFAAEKEGKIRGYIIVRPVSKARTGVIVDLLDVREPEVTQALLRRAMDYFAANGARKIEMSFSNDYYESQLKAAGFSKLEREPVSGDILVARSFSPLVRDDIFYKPENWFINTADTWMA